MWVGHAGSHPFAGVHDGDFRLAWWVLANEYECVDETILLKSTEARCACEQRNLLLGEKHRVICDVGLAMLVLRRAVLCMVVATTGPHIHTYLP